MKLTVVYQFNDEQSEDAEAIRKNVFERFGGDPEEMPVTVTAMSKEDEMTKLDRVEEAFDDCEDNCDFIDKLTAILGR